MTDPRGATTTSETAATSRKRKGPPPKPASEGDSAKSGVGAKRPRPPTEAAHTKSHEVGGHASQTLPSEQGSSEEDSPTGRV